MMHPALPFGSEFPQAQRQPGGQGFESARFLIDLDGTLIRGGRPVNGAPELLRRLAGRSIVISNNSSHTTGTLADELDAMGLVVPAECIVLAGDFALRLIRREHSGAGLLLVGNEQMASCATGLGIRLVQEGEQPDIVLLTRDDTFDYSKLCRSVDAVRRGALLIAANPDICHPDIDNRIVPETGALLQSLLACPGVQLHQTIGKPGPLLLEEGVRRLGCRPEDCIVIGDNPSTDGTGAAALGMSFAHVDADDLSRDLTSMIARLGIPELGTRRRL